jgi:hypothetical protein
MCLISCIVAERTQDYRLTNFFNQKIKIEKI